MNTIFNYKTIEIAGYQLTIDSNSKVTASNGTFDHPEPNCFSLDHIRNCPMSTEICRNSCYVHGLKKHAPDLHATYIKNADQIREILKSDEMMDIVSTEMAKWINDNCKEFRWHVSGDIFCEDYAMFISQVCCKAPKTLFWIYTRSFDFLDVITSIPNLVVNLSADMANLEAAFEAQKEYNLRICYLSKDGEVPPNLPEDSVIFPDYAIRGRHMDEPTKHAWWQSIVPADQKKVCPVDFFGQAESRRCGVCTKCMKEFKG